MEKRKLKMPRKLTRLQPKIQPQKTRLQPKVQPQKTRLQPKQTPLKKETVQQLTPEQKEEKRFKEKMAVNQAWIQMVKDCNQVAMELRLIHPEVQPIQMEEQANK